MDLYANGTVVVTPPSIITTGCKLYLADFPFDKMVCELKFSRFEYLTFIQRCESASVSRQKR